MFSIYFHKFNIFLNRPNWRETKSDTAETIIYIFYISENPVNSLGILNISISNNPKY